MHRTILAAAALVAMGAAGVLAVETQKFETVVNSALSKDSALLCQAGALKASVQKNAAAARETLEE